MDMSAYEKYVVLPLKMKKKCIYILWIVVSMCVIMFDNVNIIHENEYIESGGSPLLNL